MMKSKLSRLLLSLVSVFNTISPHGVWGQNDIFINFGGNNFTDDQGNTWIADRAMGISGGRFSTSIEIGGTVNDPIYQSELWAKDYNDSLEIKVPIKNGLYEVRMHFAEIFSGCQKTQCRIFDCWVQGVAVYQELDIFALVGGYSALTINAASRVDDGILKVNLKPRKQNPKISGLEVHRVVETEKIEDFFPLFINAGGGNFTDSSGRVWEPDDSYVTGASGKFQANPKVDIRNTQDDGLYRTERFGSRGPLKYQAFVPKGYYRATLHFAEIYQRKGENNATGRRVFDVSVQGHVAIENLDIYSEVGYFTRMTIEVPAVVMDGLLTIEFLPKKGYPKISAIQVEAVEELYRWDSSRTKGLNMVVINALSKDWESIFQETISSWDFGYPDALNLVTIEHPPDFACAPIPGRIKICNGDYGDKSWLGLSTVVLRNGFIANSVIRMNDYFLNMATEDQRHYSMCHEFGHAFGLPHTDEDYYNQDSGSCLDYTVRPEDNTSPGKYNFNLLAQLYGVNVNDRMLEAEHETAKRVAEKNPPGTVLSLYNDFVAAMEVMTCKEWETQSGDDLLTTLETELGEACELNLGSGYSIQIHKLFAWPDMR